MKSLDICSPLGPKAVSFSMEYLGVIMCLTVQGMKRRNILELTPNLHNVRGVMNINYRANASTGGLRTIDASMGCLWRTAYQVIEPI